MERIKMTGKDLLTAYGEGRRDFTFANLRDADLSGAHLSGANLRDVDLRDVDLRGHGIKTWQLFRRQWILTPTHLHAGCIRLLRSEPMPESWVDRTCGELSEVESEEANQVLALMLTLSPQKEDA